jgi:hypothetical protein
MIYTFVMVVALAISAMRKLVKGIKYQNCSTLTRLFCSKLLREQKKRAFLGVTVLFS